MWAEVQGRDQRYRINSKFWRMFKRIRKICWRTKGWPFRIFSTKCPKLQKFNSKQWSGWTKSICTKKYHKFDQICRLHGRRLLLFTPYVLQFLARNLRFHWLFSSLKLWTRHRITGEFNRRYLALLQTLPFPLLRKVFFCIFVQQASRRIMS